MKEKPIVPGHPPEDLTGQVINGRILEGYIREDRYWKWHWACVVHGKISNRPMRVKDMKNKKGPSCCYNRAGQANANWQGFYDIPMTYINQVYNGAIVRGHMYEITPQDMWSQWLEQNGRCAYTGRLLTLGKDASLDRRDSKIGYLPENIQWLHKDVNMAKQGMTEEVFLTLCQEVASNMG